jgi:creatinine amidohydrolase
MFFTLTNQYIKYLESKPLELENMINKIPIAYIPFGALEWHGEHNVLGVDSIKATEICRRSAELTGGVLFPCINYGAFDTMNFPYTFSSGSRPYIRMTKKLVKQLYKAGFRIIILLTGHYPTKQIKQVKKAAKKISKKKQDCFALGIPEQYLIPDLDYYGDHAAFWETSIMMAINLNYVNLSNIPKGLNFTERSRIHGILGIDPNISTIETGQKALDLIVRRLSNAILEVQKTHSIKPFNDIYEEYAKLRGNKFDFAKTFRIYGINDKKEGLKYLSWMLFKKGKHNPNFKDKN